MKEAIGKQDATFNEVSFERKFINFVFILYRKVMNLMEFCSSLCRSVSLSV